MLLLTRLFGLVLSTSNSLAHLYCFARAFLFSCSSRRHRKLIIDRRVALAKLDGFFKCPKGIKGKIHEPIRASHVDPELAPAFRLNLQCFFEPRKRLPRFLHLHIHVAELKVSSRIWSIQTQLRLKLIHSLVVFMSLGVQASERVMQPADLGIMFQKRFQFADSFAFLADD